MKSFEAPPAEEAKPEAGPRILKNIFEDLEGTTEAVIAVETELAGKQIEDPQNKFLIEGRVRGAAHGANREVEDGKIRTVSGFEGFHGFNRYRIFSDGVVKLSVAHSTGECIKKAKEVGILALDMSLDYDEPCPCGSGRIYGKCAHRF